MSRNTKTPRPIYRKPEAVPVKKLTDADWRAWAERINADFQKSPAEAMAEHVAYLRERLRAVLRAVGAEFVSEAGEWQRMVPGWGHYQTGDDVVRYPTQDAPPEAAQAVEALRELHALKAAEGEARVLAAYRLGRLVERYNVEALLAKPVDDVRKREEARLAGLIPPQVVAATKAWWATHRASYPSDNAARIACAKAIGGKPSRVRTIIEKH